MCYHPRDRQEEEEGKQCIPGSVLSQGQVVPGEL